MRIGVIAMAVAALAAAGAGQARGQTPLNSPAAVEDALRTAGRPMAIYVAGREGFGLSAGESAPGAPFTVDTPLRLASNTKTFVAATALRLWETGRLDLDAPIGRLLTPRNELLQADGYDTGRITVRHLLSHSGGLYDHGGDPRFTQTITSEPDRRWTREDLVRLSMSYADPQSEPGTEFSYSDTGYILLGDIIERLTGQNLAAAVRTELDFEGLGLNSTWWEIMENPPGGAAPRARQWLGSLDVTDIDASMDLYGGGGLVMSMRDLAIFTAALFEGRVFARPGTLNEMLWKGPHRDAEQYRLGIFVKQAGSRTFYWHSGFWGTLVYYDPATRRAVAGATTNQDAFGRLRALVEQVAGAPVAG